MSAYVIFDVEIRDMVRYQDFILEQVSPTAQLEKIHCSFALKQVLYNRAPPISPGLRDS